MKHPEGAKVALTADQIADFLHITDTIDWTQPRASIMSMLEKRYRWVPVNARRMRLPSGLSATVLGTSLHTSAIRARHSEWDLTRSDTDLMALDHLEEVRQLISTIVGSPAKVGTLLDTENVYQWDLPDRRRILAGSTILEVVSPQSADADRWVESDPQKYASYGEEGEYA